MASYNKVILMGNLTRDPELRYAGNNNAICKLGLAVNRTYTKADGTKQEETTFVDVDAFGRQAETIQKYLRRGDPIFVEGRLRLDQWESNGEKRSKLNVVLENFQFVSGRRDGAGGGEAGGDDAGGGYDAPPPPRAGGYSRGAGGGGGGDMPPPRAPRAGGGSGRSSPPPSNPPPRDLQDDDVPF